MNSYTEEMKGKTNMLTLDKFEEASEKVKEVTLETKLIYSDFLSDQTGNKVYLKPENMQFTGAYKVRGAYYKISTLTDEERAKDSSQHLQETMRRVLRMLQSAMAARLSS